MDQMVGEEIGSSPRSIDVFIYSGVSKEVAV